MIPLLTPREKSQLDAAIVLLKRGEVALAQRVVLIDNDPTLIEDIRDFVKSCEPKPNEIPPTLTWEMTRDEPEQWMGRGLPQFDYMLVGQRNGNYSIYKRYFSQSEKRDLIGLIPGLRFYLPFEEARAKCEEHFKTQQPAVPA